MKSYQCDKDNTTTRQRSRALAFRHIKRQTNIVYALGVITDLSDKQQFVGRKTLFRCHNRYRECPALKDTADHTKIHFESGQISKLKPIPSLSPVS